MPIWVLKYSSLHFYPPIASQSKTVLSNQREDKIAAIYVCYFSLKEEIT